MKRHCLSSLAGILSAAAMVSGLAGCDGTGNARHVTEAEVARRSLESALSAWRDGRPCGPIEGSPAIQVSDARWRDGRRIEAFEIGEEHTDGDGIRQFTVALTFPKSKKAEEARFVVYGRDPVWIFSEEDYKRMIDMGNGSDTSRSRGNTAKQRGR